MTIPQPHYLIAPSALEYHQRLPVAEVVTAPIFANMVPSDEETTVPVTLTVDPLSQAWRVRWEYGVLGEIPATVREQYPSLTRVIASGFVPETLAIISTGAGTSVNVEVLLPAPELAVPRNDVAANSWILPSGSAFMVETIDGEISALDLELYSPGQWLVTLVELNGTVVATIDGRVAGTIGGERNDDLLAYVRAAQQRHPDSPIAARGYIVDSAVVLDAGFPRADEFQLPALAVPDSRPRHTRQLFLAEDGALVVSVDRIAALDPADELAPHPGARPVRSPRLDPGNFEHPDSPEHPTIPAIDDGEDNAPDRPEPTDSSPVEGSELRGTPGAHSSEAGSVPDSSLEFDGRYLTEVEKVRARRARRRSGDGPRHASGAEAPETGHELLG